MVAAVVAVGAQALGALVLGAHDALTQDMQPSECVRYAMLRALPCSWKHW